MATARLQVLDEYAVDDNDYLDFMDDLKLWASKWVPEIQLAIAKESRGLFGNQAVRMLVGAWAEMERKDAAAAASAFDRAAECDGVVNPDDFKGIGTSEKGGYSEALYMLLVR